jgi:hypothetical protein
LEAPLGRQLNRSKNRMGIPDRRPVNSAISRPIRDRRTPVDARRGMRQQVSTAEAANRVVLDPARRAQGSMATLNCCESVRLWASQRSFCLSQNLDPKISARPMVGAGHDTELPKNRRTKMTQSHGLFTTIEDRDLTRATADLYLLAAGRRAPAATGRGARWIRGARSALLPGWRRRATSGAR